MVKRRTFFRLKILQLKAVLGLQNLETDLEFCNFTSLAKD
jgi:hypothetical protein